jgi:hypothetical protein
MGFAASIGLGVYAGGAFGSVSTPQWVGGDTNPIGGETRRRIAPLPVP